jgi:hypothetical protein
VEELAAHPDAASVFGARGDRRRLHDPLTPAELAELEAQIKVRLPEEYRGFLLEVGAGGAGPAYGVFPVVRKDARWQWVGQDVHLSDLEKLPLPFAHVEAFNPFARLPDRPEEDDYDSDEEFEAAEAEYEELFEEVAYDATPTYGLLYLCHHGCGFRDALVVTGPARGHMWTDRTPDLLGFEPLGDADGAPLTFGAWYLQWLDTATRRLAATGR